ncbi:metallothionein-I transcription activator [Apiospora kogelbergensis]|uniref:Metallothionein-I transcription activator n=1 Tax=Apiospora kogelbergensis TaxID=1337665 RepID=A0AAW0QA26_9PEZI
MSSQREAYQIPSGQQSPSAGMAMRSVVNTSSAANDEGLPMRYICGDCGTTFPLKRADTIRCVECGCRVLYKERTKRMVQFEAR